MSLKPEFMMLIDPAGRQLPLSLQLADVIYRTRGIIETQPRIGSIGRGRSYLLVYPTSARHRQEDHPAQLTSRLAAKAVTVAGAGAHPVWP